MGKEKDLSIEILRIIAIFFVIFNHTWGIDVFASVPFGGKRWLIYSVFSLFCKMSVPVFFMISGALLLGKNESLERIAKRIGKSFLELCIITLIYVLYKFFRYGEVHGLSDYLQYLFTGKGLSAHLWFMYAYIAFLISIPLLEGIIMRFNRELILWICGCVILFSSIQFLQYMIGNNVMIISDDLKPSWFMSNIVFFPILGWYMYNKEIDHLSLISFIAIIAGLVLPLIELYYLGYRNGRTYDGVYTQQFHNQFVFLIAIGVFGLSRPFKKFHCKYLEKILLEVGGATYGIYIIHIMIKDLKINKNILDAMIDKMGIEIIVAILIYVSITYMGSLIIVLLFNKMMKLLDKFMRLAIKNGERK